jgi:hypothetical protein|tara:strand:+ start:334 stop:552 length:219 start_codon:yes stop_codon:yes gene_type:complete
MVTIEELVAKNGTVNGNLIGVDGNAFIVISYTTGQLRRGGWPREDISKVSEIAMSGDYDNVLATCAATLNFE